MQRERDRQTDRQLSLGPLANTNTHSQRVCLFKKNNKKTAQTFSKYFAFIYLHFRQTDRDRQTDREFSPRERERERQTDRQLSLGPLANTNIQI